MKIAFLNRHQNTTERGAEIFVKELSDRLSKKHEVDILSGKDADSLGNIIKGSYDVVIPINGRMQSLKISLGRMFSRYKLLITGHSGKGRDDIWNILIARPDIFIGLTEDMINWAKQFAFGVKVKKISNGIDLDKFSPVGPKLEIDLPRPIILSVGALVWYKQHDKVINAVSGLGRGSVLIAGEGPLREELLKLGKEKLGDRFMISKYNYKDMPLLYRGVDLFTLPSWDREAFGIVYLEALASGLGVVAPNDASRREIIQDAGILVKVGDVKSYTKALEEALDQDWKEKAREQAKKFSWDKIATEYEDTLSGLLK